MGYHMLKVQEIQEMGVWVGFLDLELFATQYLKQQKIMIKIRTQIFLSWFVVNEATSSPPPPEWFHLLNKDLIQ